MKAILLLVVAVAIVGWMSFARMFGVKVHVPAMRKRDAAVFFAMCMACAVIAQKGTNDPPRGASSPCSEQAGTDLRSVLNGRVASSMRTRPGCVISTPRSGQAPQLRTFALAGETNVLRVADFAVAPGDGEAAFALEWAANLFEYADSNGLYLFSSTNLLDRVWTPLGLFLMPTETNECSFAVTPEDVEPESAESFVDSLLGVGFYTFGIDFDSDGDGIPDVLELRCTLTDPALYDTDGDGLSDLEELLTHLTDPLAADTDSDGVSDGDEIASGSNPFEANSDGDSLSDAQEIALGTDPARTDTDGDGLPDSDEVSTHLTDPLLPDTDGDGLSDGLEISIGTNPLSSDSDHDGMPDGWEHSNGLNPVADDSESDLDQDGLANAEEFRLGTKPGSSDTDNDGIPDRVELGWWEYASGIPVFDTSSGTNLLKASTSYDERRFTLPLPFPFVAAGHVHTAATICVNGAVGLLPTGSDTPFAAPFTNKSLTNNVVSVYNTTIAAYWDDLYAKAGGGSQITMADVTTNGARYAVIEYSRIRLREYMDDPSATGTFQVVIPKSETNTVYVHYLEMTNWFDGSSATVGAQLPNAHRSFQVSFNEAGSVPSGTTVAYRLGTGSDPCKADSDGDGMLDGVEFAMGLSAKFADTDMDGLPDGWEVANGLDPFSAEGDDGPNGDPDSDGVTNARELEARTSPQSADTDGDTIPDATELLNGTNPAYADTDGDGLSDAQEAAIGTNPLQPDTDGDGMADGWEYAYRDAGFNPLVNNANDGNPDNDLLADPDGDGLSNWDESVMNTNPSGLDEDEDDLADGLDTDGDGMADGAEVQQSSDPADASDCGLPGSRTAVSFYFGDESGSNSEKYRLEITPVSGEGAPPASFAWVNAYYGQAEIKTAMLKPGWKYSVRMRWVSCSEPLDGYDFPNYDYTLAHWTSGGEPDGVVVYDPEGLFQTDYYGTQYYGASYFPVLDKTAYIYVLEPPRLIPDYDRDGVIGDADKAQALQGKTFRFWINDDEDRLSTDGKYSEDPRTDRPGARSGLWELDRRDPDWARPRVNGYCDLLDFTPLYMDVSSIQMLPESIRGSLQFRLRHADEAVNIVWSGLSKSEAGRFQTNDVSVCGSGLDEDSCRASTERIKASGTVVPDALAVQMKAPASDKGVVFVEGRKETESPLVLDVLHEGRVVASGSLPTMLPSVEKMYWFYSLRGAEKGQDFQLPAHYTPESLPAGLDDRTVFFTHGFNVNAEDARSWGSEIFKRLWQSGSNAKFAMVTWEGNYHWLGNWGNGVHYHEDVYNALKSGSAYKQLVEREAPVVANRVLMSQSLGNMVTCEALRQGLTATQYFMFDAAVASEAIDATYQGADSATRGKYVPADWSDYHPMSWAANWHKWFKDDASDSRGKMGWPGYFEAALDSNVGTVYNYYSSGDLVFKESTTPPDLAAGVLHWPTLGWSWLTLHPTLHWELTAEANCWQKQETHKGLEPVAGSLAGGWGFDTWTQHTGPNPTDIQIVYYSAVAANAMVADGSITNNPVFKTAGTQLGNRDATQDGIYRALAEHVPAVSSPVGGMPVFGSSNRDVDMHLEREQGLPRPNGWGRINAVYGQAWLHSDMKDMAFFYVYPLYYELVTKGDLK